MSSVDVASSMMDGRFVLARGPWLHLRRRVPDRFRPLALRVERMLYAQRGVPLRLDGRWIRCAVDSVPDFSMAPDHVEERALMARVLGALQPGDCFLDVGSHAGFYAIAAAFRVGAAGRVIAFEPTPATVAKMMNNLSLNRLASRVDVQPIAASDRAGATEFVTTGTSMMNSIFTGKPDGRERSGGAVQRIVVQTRALDDFFDPDRRTVAKIDTEGHELPVLSGARRVLASNARIFLELHPWAWSSEDDDWARLRAIVGECGRRLTRSDGSTLDRPAHTRVELTRA